MNWRYIIGKSISTAIHGVLASPLMPITRVVPIGISHLYDVKRFYQGQPLRTILDVGANVGQTSLFFNRYFPEADIFAFEPVQQTFEALTQNTHHLERIRPVHIALGSIPMQQQIEVRENSELNTLVNCPTLIAPEKAELITVTTLDQFCKDASIETIDLLKLDVQGYEMQVLQGAKHYLEQGKIRFIYSEISFEPEAEMQDFQELNDFLVKHHFRFSGFYEVFRWGERKAFFGFCNALFIHDSVHDKP